MSKKRKTTLPDVTFGVELECVLPRGFYTESQYGYGGFSIEQKLAAHGLNIVAGMDFRYWSYTHDGGSRDNMNYGPFEIRSPILRGEEGLAELTRMMQALKDLGGKAALMSGMHVHVGAQDLTMAQVKQWRIGFLRYAHQIDRLLPRYRLARGYGARSQIGGRSFSDIRNDTIYSGRAGAFSVRGWKGENSYLPTVEIRAHQSTLDAEKAVHWVRLMLHLRQRALKSVKGRKFITGMDRRALQRFLAWTGVPRETRLYWLRQARIYQCNINEDMPQMDVNYVRDALNMRPLCGRAA